MNFQYKDLYIKLGLNITYYRRANSMTQDSLAEKIGIDRTHIGKFETARSGVSLDCSLPSPRRSTSRSKNFSSSGIDRVVYLAGQFYSLLCKTGWRRIRQGCDRKNDRIKARGV